MAESPPNLNKSLEEWLERNFSPNKYTSCIKINGRPILPPLMSEERRIEMRRLRDIAVELEAKMKRGRASNTQEDIAGGEAMYEGIVDELHFANSLPSSLAPNLEESTQLLHGVDVGENPQATTDAEDTSTPCVAGDMLKEFDPLAEEIRIKSFSPLPLLDLNSTDFQGKSAGTAETTISKPSSPESSVALSYSTDLNNYMDMTEGSMDVSMRGSDLKSAPETGTNTPSTVCPDSDDNKFLTGVPKWDGRATYEDLNNYLDSLLNSSSCSKKSKPCKDSNQNVVTSSTSPPDSEATLSPPSVPQGTKPYSIDPPPLKSPQGSLQTRIVNDSNNLTNSVWKTMLDPKNSADFLQECALSPVAGNNFQKSYEQKVQQYLQNLVIDEGTVRDVPYPSSLQHQSNLKENFKRTAPFKNFSSGDPEINLNGCNAVPPRLVRSNSYTLDSPSPMLVAHMEAELEKNARNDVMGEKSTSHAASSARRVWDVEASKNMPSWCNKPSQTTNANWKPQSPKKTFNRSLSAQPNSSGSHARSEVPADISQRQLKPKQAQAAKNTAQQFNTRRPGLTSTEREASTKTTEITPQGLSTTSSDENSQNKVRDLLLQLQYQHNQEMEELIKRQQKETEAIRLALLEEKRESVLKSSEGESQRYSRSQTPENPHQDLVTQSPPTKDKATRRNTSPSLYGQESCVNHLKLRNENKSSSVSLEDVPTSGNNALVDLTGDGRQSSSVIPYKNSAVPETNQPYGTEFYMNAPGLSNCYNGTSDMISSFPPVDQSCSSRLENMTSSLPPEILSLQFTNTEVSFENANSMLCTAQSASLYINRPKPASGDVASIPQSILSSALASYVSNGSPRSKRKSWCSRQLFQDDLNQGHPDWVTQSQQVLKHQAAARIQAGVRGYLTRRLLKTERVQNCITTIRDTVVCALQLQQECVPNVEPSDLQLHGRLIQQLSAACEDLHNIFMGLSVEKRMAIIASDRERLRVRTPRSQSSSGSRPLSRATQIALQRKMNQTDPSDSISISSRASSANRSRRRSWATVESRVRASIMSSSAGAGNNYEVVMGCLSRSSAPVSLPLQRSASAGSSRKPWR